MIKNSSKIIALSAIATAFATILLTVGVYFEIADIFCTLMASVIIIIPVLKGSYLAGILTSIATLVLSLILGGFNLLSVVYPAFLGFFGFYPIFQFYFCKKHIKSLFRYLIGLLWCVLAFYGILYFYINVAGFDFTDVPEFLVKYKELAIFVFGVIFYFIYDRFLIVSERVLFYYINKIFRF